MPAAFAWPQFPVAREYFRPEVIVLALINGKLKIDFFAIVNALLKRHESQTSKHGIKTRIKVIDSRKSNYVRDLLNIRSHVPRQLSEKLHLKKMLSQ